MYDYITCLSCGGHCSDAIRTTSGSIDLRVFYPRDAFLLPAARHFYMLETLLPSVCIHYNQIRVVLCLVVLNTAIAVGEG